MNVHAQNVSHKYNNKQRNHRNMNISLSNAKLQQVLEICKVKAIDLTRAVDDLGKVKIEFPAFDDRGECQLPDPFYWIKKYCS